MLKDKNTDFNKITFLDLFKEKQDEIIEMS